MLSEILVPEPQQTKQLIEKTRAALSPPVAKPSSARAAAAQRKEAEAQPCQPQAPVVPRELLSPFFINPFSIMRSVLQETRPEETWTPQLEAFEKDESIVVRADLPGLRKEDLRVEVREGVLHLEGKRTDKGDEKRGGSVWHTERSYGAFHRSITLPEGTDAREATATFDNGVLEVRLKAPPPRHQVKRIEIQEAAAPAKKSRAKPANSRHRRPPARRSASRSAHVH